MRPSPGEVEKREGQLTSPVPTKPFIVAPKEAKYPFDSKEDTPSL